MTSRRRYCLDTNSLITAKDGPYGFSIVPSFWAMLEDKIRSGIVYSPWAVYREWMAGEDDLKEWVKRLRGEGLRVQPTAAVQGKYSKIVSYVQGHYENHQAALFLSKADPWVVAQAWEDSTEIVTFEVAVNPSAKKVKIPDVCKKLCPDAKCRKTWEMVKAFGGLP